MRYKTEQYKLEHGMCHMSVGYRSQWRSRETADTDTEAGRII